VGGPEIVRLNKAFIGKSHRTDVIAFNYPPSPAPDAAFGDIFVCLPQARAQARELGHPLERELLLLALHGALHLAGMDDNTAARRAAMHRRAERLAAGL
jgi:rRNA maturation RNase YbeY